MSFLDYLASLPDEALGPVIVVLSGLIISLISLVFGGRFDDYL